MTITSKVTVIVVTNVEHNGFTFSVDNLNRVRYVSGPTAPKFSDREARAVYDLARETARLEVKEADCYINSSIA